MTDLRLISYRFFPAFLSEKLCSVIFLLVSKTVFTLQCEHIKYRCFAKPTFPSWQGSSFDFAFLDELQTAYLAMHSSSNSLSMMALPSSFDFFDV